MDNYKYKFDTPIEPEMWAEPGYDDDYAYSIAIIGDPQWITCGDRFCGTRKLYQIFKYVADTAEKRRVKHVFMLGDITDEGYHNDANLAYAHTPIPLTEEWELAKEAVSLLDEKKIPYSLCRGNHDDYMIDDYFNVPEYTDQFIGCGGFFTDSDGRHPERREKLNPEGYIYWSAIRGHYESSIVNSYKEVDILGTKYLFVTSDFNPNKAVAEWLDSLLTKYSDRKVILATHGFLTGHGVPITTDAPDTMFPFEYPPSVLWEKVLSKHENLVMIISGHAGAPSLDIVHSFATGVNGNRVLQLMVNPQNYDTKEKRDGTFTGKQDTGMVLYMNFSSDGETVTFNYYSTLLNKDLKDNDYVFNLGKDPKRIK